MKIIKKSFIILIFFGYFFIFGRQLEPEISFIPLWVENVGSGKVVTGDINDEFIDFRLDGKFGYLNGRGEILFSENLLYGVAIDSDGFINYSSQNDVLVLKNNKGQFLTAIELSGYPYFISDRRFIISYDSNGISEIDHEGSVIWRTTFSSSISSLSASSSLIFVGTVDGRIILLDSTGRIVYSHNTRNSRINVVYGGSVSSDNEHMMTVTGIEPQVLTLWNKSGDEYQVEFTWSLSSELRRHAAVGFSDDGLFAYVEAEEEILLIELKNKKLYSVPMTGRLQSISFFGDSSLVYILGKDHEGSYLVILETDGSPLFYSRLAGNEVMLKKDLNKIILGIDKNLITYDLESL